MTRDSEPASQRWLHGKGTPVYIQHAPTVCALLREVSNCTAMTRGGWEEPMSASREDDSGSKPARAIDSMTNDT